MVKLFIIYLHIKWENGSIQKWISIMIQVVFLKTIYMFRCKEKGLCPSYNEVILEL